MKKCNKKQDVDIVFLWVDGNDPLHKQKKEQYLKNALKKQAINSKAVSDYRWRNDNEILIALKSIELYCPWVSNVWIITDNQKPDIGSLSVEFRKKIKIVDHKDVFEGYEEYLPTFNSRSIETMIWRIKELANNFVYFNDDMFVLRPLSKNDFFLNNKPVLRGTLKKINEKKTYNMHQYGMINSTKMLDSKNKYFFYTAHAPYTMKKEFLRKLFDEHKKDFEKNISYRIRNNNQFKVVSLLYQL